jgi:hypothetical protein
MHVVQVRQLYKMTHQHHLLFTNSIFWTLLKIKTNWENVNKHGHGLADFENKNL